MGQYNATLVAQVGQNRSKSDAATIKKKKKSDAARYSESTLSLINTLTNANHEWWSSSLINTLTSASKPDSDGGFGTRSDCSFSAGDPSVTLARSVPSYVPEK